MTKEITPFEKITYCWNETDCTAKELFTLQENGDIILSQTALFPERVIANIMTENPSVILNSLVERFKDVLEKVTEIQKEWEEAEDKIKISGKIARTKEYLLHTNAIGDFIHPFTLISGWETEIEKIEEKNFGDRLAIVQEAEQLVSETDMKQWKTIAQRLKELSDQWKTIGYTEKTKSDKLWNRFEDIRTNFFEQKRSFLEDQEKEMLQNLDLKIEITEKAERLAASDDWRQATEAFRTLLEEWKAIGKTPHERNEELWNRFILAKNIFYDRKKNHFEQIQTEQESNYKVKLALVEKAEELKDNTDWNVTTRKYADLMEEWKSTGRVPPEKADELWERLNAAKDFFFNAKRQHLDVVRVTMEDNYAQKAALLKRAEAIKTSTQWRETTEEMNELMEEWKRIGRVPREHANDIWEKFIKARKSFFERKDAHREHRRQQAEKQERYKLEQTSSFLHKLQQEMEEERLKATDFQEALQNLTPGSSKEEELRTHLTKLLSQTTSRITQKEAKIQEVSDELHQLEEKYESRKQEKTTGKEDACGDQ